MNESLAWLLQGVLGRSRWRGSTWRACSPCSRWGSVCTRLYWPPEHVAACRDPTTGWHKFDNLSIWISKQGIVNRCWGIAAVVYSYHGVKTCASACLQGCLSTPSRAARSTPQTPAHTHTHAHTRTHTRTHTHPHTHTHTHTYIHTCLRVYIYK